MEREDTRNMRWEVIWDIRDARGLSHREKAFLWAVESRAMMRTEWEKAKDDMGMKKDMYYRTRESLHDKRLIRIVRNYNGTTCYVVDEKVLESYMPKQSDSHIANEDSDIENEDSHSENEHSHIPETKKNKKKNIEEEPKEEQARSLVETGVDGFYWANDGVAPAPSSRAGLEEPSIGDESSLKLEESSNVEPSFGDSEAAPSRARGERTKLDWDHAFGDKTSLVDGKEEEPPFSEDLILKYARGIAFSREEDINSPEWQRALKLALDRTWDPETTRESHRVQYAKGISEKRESANEAMYV